MFAFSLAILASFSSAGEIAAVVDPRVEAMCIVFHLAGNPEYARTAPGSKYVAAALEHFEPFKKHAAVKLAAELRRKSGISFDAPMSLAVHLEDVASAKLRVPLDPWPATLDRRWTTKSAPEFAAALADFVRESDFDGFMKKHAPLQRASAERLQFALRRRPFLSWLDEFYGPKPKGGFAAIVGLMAGPNNYGVSVKLADGTHELSPVLGVASVDAAGLPVFGGGIDGLIIHEFSHAYVNPLVDANIKKLAAAGEKLFKLRERAFRQQAYGDARTVLYESLVRACETKIIERNLGPQAGDGQRRMNVGRGFLCTPDLVRKLDEYLADRKKYPDLPSFMPVLAATLESATADPSALGARTPKLVKSTPAAGDADVPLETELRLEFDRAMVANSYSVSFDGPQPAMTTKPRWEDAGKTFIIAMSLKAGAKYRMLLNSRGTGFASPEGYPLELQIIPFNAKEAKK